MNRQWNLHFTNDSSAGGNGFLAATSSGQQQGGVTNGMITAPAPAAASGSRRAPGSTNDDNNNTNTTTTTNNDSSSPSESAVDSVLRTRGCGQHQQQEHAAGGGGGGGHHEDEDPAAAAAHRHHYHHDHVIMRSMPTSAVLPSSLMPFPLLSSVNISRSGAGTQSLFGSSTASAGNHTRIQHHHHLGGLSGGATVPRSAGGLLMRASPQDLDYETLLLRNSIDGRRRMLAAAAAAAAGGGGVMASPHVYGHGTTPASLAMLLRARAGTALTGNPYYVINNTSNPAALLNAGGGMMATEANGSHIGIPPPSAAARVAASSRFLNTLQPNSRLMQQQQPIMLPLSTVMARGGIGDSNSLEMLSLLNSNHINNQASAVALLLPPSSRGGITTVSRPSANFHRARGTDMISTSRGGAKTKHIFASQEEADRFWMIQFQNLKQFREEYGHCHVPVYYKSNITLGQWVNNMRHVYRQYKSSGGETNGILNETKVKLLEDLGFACKKKPGLLWMAQYNLLKSFKEQNGHCHVPMHWKNDRKLGHWVNNQRQLYRKYKSGLPTSMNESRIELLEEIGFAWILGKDWKEKRKEDTKKSIKEVSSTTESQSIESSNEEYNEESITVVESSKKDDDELESPEENIVGENFAENANEGETAGDFDPSTPVPSDIKITNQVASDPTAPNEMGITPPDKNVDTESSVQTCSVVPSGRNRLKRKLPPTIPEVEVDGRILSHILFSDRPGQFGTDDSDADSDNSTEGRNFRRSTKRIRMPYNTDKHWNKRFEDLVQFKDIHGDCHVPFQYAENKSLSYWVSNQRQKYRQFLKGEESTLNQERIDALLSLGFKFNARDALGAKQSLDLHAEETGTMKIVNPARGVPSPVDPSWDARINDLKEYKQKHGDCLVPSIHLANRQLGIWVMNQRQYYRRFIKGQRSPLAANKIAVLNELGFCWSLDGRRNRAINHDTVQGGNHICVLDDALTRYILSFLLDIKDILSFSSTSKYYYELFNESEDSNDLLMCIYLHKYSNERLMNMSEWSSSQSVSMLDAWRDMSKFKMAVKLQTNLDEEAIALVDKGVEMYLRPAEGIGILTPRQESQAILKDNASLVPSNDLKKYCAGYSGMIRFNVHPPMMHDDVDCSGKVELKEQIAIWGDFQGIRVCNSVEDLLSKQSGDVFHSVGKARFGRVFTIIPAPPIQMESERQPHPRRPCLYLGCVSGAVIGLFPVPGDETALDYDYGMSAMTFAHSGCVTALSVLHVPMSSAAGGGEFLLSAGRDGKVHLYPNSFSARHQFEIHSRVLCCENKTPILSLASNESDSSFFIFTGDEGGKIIIWKSRPGSTLRRSRDVDGASPRGVRTMSNFEPIFTLSSLDAGSKISKLSLFKRNVLVSGNDGGDVRVFDIVEKKTYIKKQRKTAVKTNASLRLAQRFIVPIAHPGDICSLTFFGDVLLTTGANDGLTKAWSMDSGDLIGAIVSFRGADSTKLCSQKGLTHTEKRVFSYEGLKSDIVSNMFCQRSMISISRAGQVCCWQFGLLLEQKVIESTELRTDESGIKCAYCQQVNAADSDYCQTCHEPFEVDQVSDGEKVEQSEEDSGDSDEEDDDSDADFDWKCQDCHATNTTSFTRCSACYAWRSIRNE